ncbi:hypothetical protein Mal64_07410 [Pseudobythopirellula maris]|uniref:Uncharacterized protein n=1 Tax=Pseudobythopirellula maris TaxID=2527991 RepID=A0A5C5ZS45_9BACT|nr:hypothetical protein Mal64_07410 [Pseudobythopirellula maris]
MHCTRNMEMLKPATAIVTAIATVMASPAWACPYCESDVGREVAAGIFNDTFALNAVLTLLPITVLMAIVWLIHSGVSWPKGVLRSARSSVSARSTLQRKSGKHPL